MEPIIELIKVTEVKQVTLPAQCIYVEGTNTTLYQPTSSHLGARADNQLAQKNIISSKLVPLDWAVTIFFQFYAHWNSVYF